MSARTAVVAPLAAELAGVLAATSARRVTRLGHEGNAWTPWRRRPQGQARQRQSATLGRLAGEEVAVMATGDGPAAAAAGLEALLAAVRPRRLLVIGVAGGLTPGLAEGTLVAARRVIDARGRAVPREPDASWLHEALAGGAIGGDVISTDRIVAGPAARQAVLRQALAGLAAVPGEALPPVATVDLESAAYARVAAAWSLPYLVVRAVLDTADEELPLDFEACRDAGGRVSNWRVVLRALLRPRSLGELWRLRARVRAAAARLGGLAQRLVAAAPAGGATPKVSLAAGGAAMTEVVEQRRDEPALAGRRTA
jgi:nucleoside phosphorylase